MTFVRIFLATTAVVTSVPLIAFGDVSSWPGAVMLSLSVVFAASAVLVRE